MEYNLTEGNITGNLLKFAFPLMIGNLLQQCYNIADTLIVGRFLGADALAAVGSAYTLMVFLTSIILGLCMGSSAFLHAVRCRISEMPFPHLWRRISGQEKKTGSTEEREVQ